MKCFSKMGRAAKRGFTLVELMVVVAILATLVGLGAIGVAKTLRGAETAKRSSFAQTVNSAIAAYKNETGEYPIPEGRSANNNNVIAFGTVNNNNAQEGNSEVMMLLLGRDTNGKRDTSKRAYITDSSMLYVCEGKRVTKLDEALAKGSISGRAMIGFPVTMAKTGNKKYKSMSKARAFAPIKITYDFDLDDCQVSIPGDGSFSEVIKLN